MLNRLTLECIGSKKRFTPRASEGGGGGASPSLDFEIISKKGCFFDFEGLKPNFTTFGSPWKKFWESPLLPPPPGKNSSAHDSRQGRN